MAKVTARRGKRDDRLAYEWNRYLVRHETARTLLAELFKWLALAFISYMAFRMVDTLAGRRTEATLNASIDWPCGPEWWMIGLACLFGVGGILYGRYQRRLRGDTIERMHDFQKKWETSIDPNRSSSNLTARGDTRPEDR